MNNKQILAAIAQDLYRVATSSHRKSTKVADRFLQEAVYTSRKVERTNIKPYLHRYLDSIDDLSKIEDLDERADVALAYSVIVQNYCLKYC